MENEYKTPILTLVLQIGAILLFVAAIVTGFAALAASSAVQIGIAVATAFAAFVYLGIGQAVEYLALSAYHNKRTADASDVMAAQLRLTAKLEAAKVEATEREVAEREAAELEAANIAAANAEAAKVKASLPVDPDIAEYIARKAARGKQTVYDE